MKHRTRNMLLAGSAVFGAGLLSMGAARSFLPSFMGSFVAATGNTEMQASADEPDVYEVSGDGSRQTRVIYDMGASFTVTIPKKIPLAKDTKSASYDIRVKGDLPSDASITVSPEDSLTDMDGINFLMQEENALSRDAGIPATVTQDDTTWTCAEAMGEGTVKAGSISAPGLTAGTWKGSLWFDITYNGDVMVGYRPVIKGVANGGVYDVGRTVTVNEGDTLIINGETIEGNSYTFNDPGKYKVESTSPNGYKTEASFTVKAFEYVQLRGAGNYGPNDAFLNSLSVDSNLTRQKITGVVFHNSAEGHYLSDDNCWDVSDAEDGSILAWYVYNSLAGTRVVHIGPKSADATIQLPESCVGLFYHIGGTLDLSSLDFSHVKDMSNMFYCGGMTVNFGDADASNVTKADNMFYIEAQHVMVGQERDRIISITCGAGSDFSNIPQDTAIIRAGSYYYKGHDHWSYNGPDNIIGRTFQTWIKNNE